MARSKSSIRRRPEPRPDWEEMLDHLRSGGLEEARDLCNQALQQSPNDPQWLLALSWCYLGAGRVERALGLAQKAAKHGPDSPLIYRTLASIHLQHDRLDDALAEAKHALRLDPGRRSKDLVEAIRRRMPAPAPRKQAARRIQPAAGLHHDDVAQEPSPPDTDEPLPHEVPRLPSELRSGVDLWSKERRTELLEMAPPDRQLAALYGESLFGTWEAVAATATGSIALRWLRPAMRRQAFMLLGVLLLLVGGLAAGARSILQRSDAKELATLADRMQQLTHGGNVEQLAELLDDPAVAQDAFTGRSGAYHKTWRRADAVLYRYYDGNPARRKRLTEAALSGPDAFETVTHALLKSAPERTSVIARLGATTRSTDDPNAALLWAEALARAGNEAEARQVLEAALAREPTHLLLLTALAERFSRLRSGRRAEEALAEMDDIRPHALWTRIGHLRSAVWMRARLPAEPPLQPSERALAPTRSVAAAERAFAAAVVAERRGSRADAAAAMASVAKAVHNEPTFLIDFADRALNLGAPQLAKVLTDSAPWPTDSVAAGSVVGRLLAELGFSDVALQKLSTAWKAGLRDPIAARRLAQLLAQTGTTGLTADSVGAEIATLFPARSKATPQRRRRAKRGRR